MRIARRDVLLGLLAGVATAGGARAQAARSLFVGGAMRGANALVAAYDGLSAPVTWLALPGRAHHLARLGVRLIVVARRPGAWAHVLRGPNEVEITLVPAAGHVFSGHVAVSPDRRAVAFVEIRRADGVGVVSLREAAGAWRETARLSTGGIGPHAALWTDDNRIVVANGGYYDLDGTDSPDGEIHGSLGLVDLRTARTRIVRPPEELADCSLRHLAPAPDGVVIGLQRGGPSATGLHPVARFRDGAIVPMGSGGGDPMRGYAGDVAVVGDLVFAASPRGGVVGLWDARDDAWLGAVRHADVCALAVGVNTCRAGAGDGAVLDLHRRSASLVGIADLAWDNHGVLL